MTQQEWAARTRQLIATNEDLDWKSDGMGLRTGFPFLDTLTRGIPGGVLLLLGARYEVGKSSWMGQLGIQMLRQNPKLYWLCFSLDDSKRFQFHRMAACMGACAINDVRYPGPETSGSAIERRESGYQRLTELAERFRVYDQADGSEGLGCGGNYIEAIEERIRQDFNVLGEMNGEAPTLLVTVDAFHNLALMTQHSGNRVTDTEAVGKRFKEIIHGEQNELPLLPILMTTTHLRKDAGRPVMDDVKDSVGPLYDADLGLLGYTDVSVKGDNAEIYHEGPDGEKEPVVELRVAKNKLNGRHGMIFYRHDRSTTRFHEEHDATRIGFWSGQIS